LLNFCLHLEEQPERRVREKPLGEYEMLRIRIRLVLSLCVGAFVALGGGNVAGAITFDSTTEGIILTNTLPDFNTFYITQLFGAFLSQPLIYTGNITPMGFSEELTGIYNGIELDVISLAMAAADGSFSWNASGH
jgi:hypothetical protein